VTLDANRPDRPAQLNAPVRGDIAIVGMACVYPQAPDLVTLWENVVAGVDAVVEMPAERIPAWFYDQVRTPIDSTSWRRGGFLDKEVPFDPLRFGIMPLIMETADPEQFLVLKTAEAALRDAGYTLDEIKGERTEIIVGRGNYPNRGTGIAQQHVWVLNEVLEALKAIRPELTNEDLAGVRERVAASLPRFRPENAAALIPNFTTGRAAARFDCMGTNFTVDAACASSLVALEIAVRDLLSHKCDMALVGGVFILSDLLPIVLFTQIGALSRGAQIRPFDARADGTLMGEGVGILVVKRLADAVQAGDRIYAVVKGVGTASDGHAVSLLAPRVEGEALALRRAYEMADIDPASIGLIEAHGTATPTGDVVEIQALVRTFGTRAPESMPHCALGSIKSMLGHTMPAAGAAGLIKTALALYHRVLPPTLHCDEPNPKLGLEQTPFYLNTTARPWIEDTRERPRRAGVNSFGFGGVNAHAILEEYRDPREDDLPSLLQRWPTEVCILDAPSREELVERIDTLLGYLVPGAPIELKNVAYTLNTTLMGARHRLAVVAASIDDLRGKLERAAKRLADPRCALIKDARGLYYFSQPLAETGSLAFLFPGEGSQYVDMLGDIAAHFPVARRVLDHAAHIARLDSVYPPPWPSYRAEAEQRLWSRISTAAQAVMAADHALLAVLERLGVRPDVVVGHSSGDFVALLAAGIVSYGEEVTASLGRLWESYDAPPDVADRAGLLAVGASEATARAKLGELASELMLALDNCPHQVVLAGSLSAVEAARERLLTAGTFCERLPFDRPYHTPAFLSQLGPLRERLERLATRPPHTKIYSCTTADVYPTEVEALLELAIEHWGRPVRFRETIQKMYQDGVRLFVELGPRGNLTAFVDDILRGESYLAIAADNPRRHGLTQLNQVVALLAAHGVPINTGELYARRSPQQLNLLEPPRVAEGAPSRPMLSLSVPRLSIPPLPEASRDSSSGVTHSDQPPMTDGRSEVQPGVDPDNGGPVLSTVESTIEAGPEPIPFSEPDAAAARMADPMISYLQTMEQFLAVQQSVMQGFLGMAARESGDLSAGEATRAGLVVEPAENGHRISTTELTGAWQLSELPSFDPLPENAGRNRSEGVSEYPLLGEVTSQVAGHQLEAERTLRLDEDLYLLDHTIGWQVSADPTLRALSVVPMTVSMEIMAEAAAALLPGLRLVGMEQLRMSRWIGVTEQGRALRISAQRLANDGKVGQRVRVVIRSRALEAEEDDVLETAAEGIVRLDAEYPTRQEPAPFELTDSRPCEVTVAELYEYLFHGPQFRVIRAVHEIGDDGLRADLMVLPLDSFLGSRSVDGMLLDPVLLDGAGQLLGAWASQHISASEVIFPIQIDEVTFFGPPLPAGSVVQARERIRALTPRRLGGDMELLGPDGRMQVKIADWQDHRFQVPENRLRFFHDPLSALVGEQWDQPTAPLPAAGGYVAVLLDGLGEKDSSALQDFIAHLVLSRAEREAWQGLRGPARQRTEWLLGRAALKDAARVYLERRYGLQIYPADIEVGTDVHGRPLLSGRWTPQLSELPVASLTHCGLLAVAVVGGGGARPYLGVDIERIRQHPAGFAEMAFQPEERAWLEMLDEKECAAWTTRLWCAKEAVGKALGHGLPGGPSNVVVEGADLTSGRVKLRLRGQLERLVPQLAGRAVVAYTSVVGDLVVASTVCEHVE
jgi:acyl transferase domain-containing protein/phosphopantetheinyl transferase